MRIFEIILLLANALALLVLSPSRPWPVWPRFLPFLALAMAVVQVVAEGYRWQMIAAYFVTVGLLILDVSAFLYTASILEAVYWTGWVLLAATVAAGTTFPVFEFPKPTGPFAVGTVVRHLVDVNRQETLAADTHGSRELMIQIWYPAETSATGKRARYIADTRQISSFFDSHLTLVATHAIASAAMSASQASYPVLIYSPSWHGQRYQNTCLIEELVAHGFVVVGIDHPFGSAVTVFPDGRIARATLRGSWDLSSDEALKRSLEYMERQLRVRVQDVEFVRNELENYNQHESGDFFSGRLDLSRLGIFGFSFGGAVAAQACWLDKRFKAAIDMDGLMLGEVAAAGVPRPFVIMEDAEEPYPAATVKILSQTPEKRRFVRLMDNDFRAEQHSLETYGGYRIGIRGAEHMNFEDSPLYSRIRYLTGAGPINPRRAMRVISVYTLAFFAKYLNHTRQSLLDGPSPDYPEVKLGAYPLKYTVDEHGRGRDRGSSAG